MTDDWKVPDNWGSQYKETRWLPEGWHIEQEVSSATDRLELFAHGVHVATYSKITTPRYLLPRKSPEGSDTIVEIRYNVTNVRAKQRIDIVLEQFRKSKAAWQKQALSRACAEQEEIELAKTARANEAVLR